MSVENNVIQQLKHAGDDVHLNERPSLQYLSLQGIPHNNIIYIYIYIYSKIHLYVNI